MKPSFALLKAAHISSNPLTSGYQSSADVYASLGLDLDELLAQNAGYANTCAVRMSIALLSVGVAFSGRLRVQGGPHKGKLIEPGAKLLADQLARKEAFGRPEILAPSTAATKVGTRRGVIFFHKIVDYGGGHIDMIEPTTGVLLCHSHCYFDCKEAWFWAF